MGSLVNVNVALSTEVFRQVQQAVDSGEYASSSEIVEDALREWTEKRNVQNPSNERLCHLWQEAQQDASPGYPMEDFMDDLEAKYQAMADSSRDAR